MKVGIFGGTFDPPHDSHLEIAKQAIKQLQTDKLLIFPAGDPPHKSRFSDGKTRAEMAELAFAGVAGAEIDRYELDKAGKSYTSETLDYVRERYPDAQLYLIVGGDSLRDFASWHCPGEIAQKATLAVAERPGADVAGAAEEARRRFGAEVLFLNVPPNAVSSTEIRLKRQFCFDIAKDVPPAVAEYIERHGLYSDFRSLTARLPQYLKPKRLSHSFYVTKAGLELPSGCDKKDIFLACALHDVAKYVPPERFAAYGFDGGDYPSSVVHAFLGALVAERDFGITDENILNAIRYHTTARPHMTELDMVVFCADKLEETRPYPTAHLKKATLKETFVATLEEAYRSCLAKHKTAYPLTEEAVKFYTKQQRGEV